MEPMTAKEIVAEALSQLPDSATFEDIELEVRTLSEIEKGEADIAAGRTVPHDEVMRQLARFL
jgi:predicted transcriptional regulator